MQVKEGGADVEEIVAVTMGPESAVRALHKAVSLGADRSVHLTDPGLAGSDVAATGYALAQTLKRESPDLVLLGHEAAVALEPSARRRLARHPGDRDAGLLPPPVSGLRAARSGAMGGQRCLLRRRHSADVAGDHDVRHLRQGAGVEGRLLGRAARRSLAARRPRARTAGVPRRPPRGARPACARASAPRSRARTGEAVGV